MKEGGLVNNQPKLQNIQSWVVPVQFCCCSIYFLFPCYEVEFNGVWKNKIIKDEWPVKIYGSPKYGNKWLCRIIAAQIFSSLQVPAEHTFAIWNKNSFPHLCLLPIYVFFTCTAVAVVTSISANRRHRHKVFYLHSVSTNRVLHSDCRKIF